MLTKNHVKTFLFERIIEIAIYKPFDTNHSSVNFILYGIILFFSHFSSCRLSSCIKETDVISIVSPFYFEILIKATTAWLFNLI